VIYSRFRGDGGYDYYETAERRASPARGVGQRVPPGDRRHHARLGVTGADRIELGDIEPRVAALRKLSAAPVAVGFGVKEPAQASAIAAFADAVVVGSALVQRLHAAADPVSEARAFLAPLRAALDAAQHGSKRTSV